MLKRGSIVARINATCNVNAQGVLRIFIEFSTKIRNHNLEFISKFDRNSINLEIRSKFDQISISSFEFSSKIRWKFEMSSKCYMYNIQFILPQLLLKYIMTVSKLRRRFNNVIANRGVCRWNSAPNTNARFASSSNARHNSYVKCGSFSV